MLISVITPFKKGREYLQDCLESLKAQSMREYDMEQAGKAAAAAGLPLNRVTCDEDTFYAEASEGVNGYGVPYRTTPYRDFELILVLDHPEEDVSDLIAAYEKEYALRVVCLKGKADHPAQSAQEGAQGIAALASEDAGVAAARNAGIESAEGDYLFFLDSDDHLFPRALSIIARAIASCGEPDLIYGNKTVSWIKRDKFAEVFEKHLAKVRSDEAKGLAVPAEENNADNGDPGDNDEGADEGDSESEENGGANGDDTGAESEDSIAADCYYVDASPEELSEHIDDIVARIRKGEVPENADNTSGIAELLRTRLSASEYEAYFENKTAYELISQRKGIRNISVLGTAYKRILINGNDIRFPEGQRYYADLEFICRAISCARTFCREYQCRYVKRRHDEQSSFPSIMDEVSGERFAQYAGAYVQTRDKLPDSDITAWRLDDKLINYFTDYYVKMMVTRKAAHWKTTRFEMMKDALSRIPSAHVSGLPFYKRRVIGALLAGDPEKVCAIRNRRDSRRRFIRRMKLSFV